jgi:apolipoprotein D and lipocalin family protein
MSFIMSSLFMPFVLLTLAACSSPPPIRTATTVNLERFMGDWYVIANIPTFIETNAYNAVESYRLAEDGTVPTTFTFREGGFEGPHKIYHPTGYILDTQSNAVWGMQFIWPFKADYRIVFLDESYSQTVIGRTARDYVWLMARTAEIPDSDYQRFLMLIAEEGYDVSKVRKVPQRWN